MISLSTESHSTHSSLGNAHGMLDSRRMSSANRETLKRSARFERQSKIAKLGISAGDRIQHHRFLKVSELDLFCPPTKLPSDHLSKEERVQWRSRTWELFSHEWSIHSPFPAQNAIDRHPPDSDPSVGKSTAPEHLGNIFVPATGQASVDVPSCPTDRMDHDPSPAEQPAQCAGISDPANMLPIIPDPKYPVQTCVRRAMPELDEPFATPEIQYQARNSEQNILKTNSWGMSRSFSSTAVNNLKASATARSDCDGAMKQTIDGLDAERRENIGRLSKMLSYNTGTSSRGGGSSAPRKSSVLDRILDEMNAQSPKTRSSSVSSMEGAISRYGTSSTADEKRERELQLRRYHRSSCNACKCSSENIDFVRGREPLNAVAQAPEEQNRPSTLAFLDAGKAFKHAVNGEKTLVGKMTKFLESAASFLSASEVSASDRPDFALKVLGATLSSADSFFRNELRHVGRNDSWACRSAIAFLKMRAFLNHRISRLRAVGEPPGACSTEELDESARMLLSDELDDFQNVGGTSCCTSDNVHHTGHLFQMKRAIELWTRAEVLTVISHNKAFFDAVECASATSSLTMPAEAFELYIKEAIHRIKAEGKSPPPTGEEASSKNLGDD